MALYPATSSVAYAEPLTEGIQWKTLATQFDDLGVEQRKQKWLYPKRIITLHYRFITKAEARTLWAFYIARKGSYEAFSFFYPVSNTYTTEYVGTGDGTTLVFNLPCKTASSYTLYVDGVAQTAGGTDYTFGALGGADGADKATFVAAPADGARITFSFTGYLKVRARFAEDNMDFETFYDRLINSELKLQGLLNA
jgi:hypothetical protein